MMLAACEQLGRRAGARPCMLGDSANDVLAARAAGCPVWCVPYGYNEGRPVGTLGADRIVASVAEAANRVLGVNPVDGGPERRSGKNASGRDGRIPGTFAD